MISLTTLLASDTVAAAAKKVDAIRPAPARVFSSTSLPPTTPDVNSKEHSVCRVQPSRPAQTDVSLFSQKENGKKFGCIAVV